MWAARGERSDHSLVRTVNHFLISPVVFVGSFYERGAIMQRSFEFAMEILVPMLAAYGLYKKLPSKASVKGPLKGLQLNLQGAFAGYFALVLLVFAFHDKLFPPPPPPPPTFEVWRVDGKIEYEDGDAEKLAGQTTIEIDPPFWGVGRDGTFHVEFIAQPGPGEELAFPVLHVDLNDQQHEPVPIYLDGKIRPYETDQYQVRQDRTTKEIVVEKPILLRIKKLPKGQAYNETSAENPGPP